MIPAEQIQLIKDSSRKSDKQVEPPIIIEEDEMAFVPEENKDDIEQFEDLTHLMGREDRKTMQQKKQEEEEIESSGKK